MIRSLSKALCGCRGGKLAEKATQTQNSCLKNTNYRDRDALRHAHNPWTALSSSEGRWRK